MAATRALEFSLEVEILTAVLGDSKIIINSLKEDNESHAPYRHLISDLKMFAKSFNLLVMYVV